MLDSVAHIHARSLFIFILVLIMHTHIELFSLMHALDMYPLEVICLSSEEETPFEHNQRLLREHHAEEDRRRVQDHLSRVLEEVKEGKRKTLRIAARPDPSRIPIAIPLASSLEVTVAYEPGDLKFNIMSQESQAGSISPAPVVEAESAPFRGTLV